MRKVLGSRLLAALVGAAVMAAVGSIAWAAIPTAEGEIHLCVKERWAKKRGGTLVKVADPDGKGCRRGETELVINQQGPKGDPGPQGERGPKGEQGPAGTGEVFANEHGMLFLSTDGATLVGTLDLPAGSWVIHAQTTTDGATECRLQLGGTVSDPSSGTAIDDVFFFGDQPQRGKPAFLATATTAQADALRLWCFTTFGGATADKTKLVAIKVGSLN